MTAKEQILKEFALFSMPTGGIGSWLSESTNNDVFERLSHISSDPLSAVQLNQLLVLGQEAPMSDGMFQYYWREMYNRHPYALTNIPGFDGKWLNSAAINSLEHLKWGLYRLYVDGLLYFGNVRTAYRSLRDCSNEELRAFYSQRRFDTAAIKGRGPALPMKPIAKDSRYLISEMACKSYGDDPYTDSALRTELVNSYRKHAEAGNKTPTIKELLGGKVSEEMLARQTEFLFSVDEVLDDRVNSEEDLVKRYDQIAQKFSTARRAALDNTAYYLSMVNDLDVYVATSMRNRNDFRAMGETCERIFGDKKLSELNLRFFDPTLSAAKGHEDKGLIECLMVKCAKVLVYCAGEKESWGKDAEAAMALSLGKPVIFLCDKAQKSRFYRDVHPLSRLIEFETGIAVGAMVADSPDQVVEILLRVFENQMMYSLEQSKPGYLRLKETLTESVVRLQTNDQLLTNTFWNHYHAQRTKHRRSGVGNA